MPSGGVLANEPVQPDPGLVNPRAAWRRASLARQARPPSYKSSAKTAGDGFEHANRVRDQIPHQVRTAVTCSQQIVSKRRQLPVGSEIQPRHMAIKDHTV